METKEIVYKTLQGSKGALKSGDIAEKSGQDKKQVDKAIKALLEEDKIFSPKRCFYEAK
jgi:hypothetical protein